MSTDQGMPARPDQQPAQEALALPRRPVPPVSTVPGPGADHLAKRLMVGIVAFLSCLAGSPSAGEESGILKRSVVVEMNVKGHLPEIELSLNGQGPFRFLVYIREGDLVVDESVADKLGLTPESVESEEGSSILMDRLTVGEHDLRGIRAQVLDFSTIFGDSEMADGVISISQFSRHLVTMDLVDRSFSLTNGTLPVPDGGRVLPYMMNVMDDGLGEGLVPIFPVQVEDRRIEMRLGFAMGGRFLFPLEELEKVPLEGKAGVIGVANTSEGSFTIRGAELDATVRLGNHEMENPGARFSEIFEEAQIGSDLLKEFSVSFDQTNRRALFHRKERSGGEGALHQGAIASLDDQAPELREAFNADKDSVRLLLILSPT